MILFAKIGIFCSSIASPLFQHCLSVNTAIFVQRKNKTNYLSDQKCAIISRAEKEGRLDLRASTGKPKNETQRVERKITKTVYDSPQTSMRRFALQVEKDLGLGISHETIRNVLEKQKYWSGTNPCCQYNIWKIDSDLLPNMFHFLRSTGMMLFSQMRRK